MDISSELSRSLKQDLSWNKCRLDCFAKMIIALLTVRTVNLTQWAVAFGGKSKVDSSYIRIKRFFRHFDFSGDVIARCIFNWFGFSRGQWYLTIDRTNWELGKIKINYLVLAIAYKGIAIPLLWSTFNKKGNSNTKERIQLIERFIVLFGTLPIGGILADREFVGERWFSYLKSKEIPFYIRITRNSLVTNSKGEKVNVWRLFLGLKKGDVCHLEGKRKVFNLPLYLFGMRCEDGDFLIVATTDAGSNAIKVYGYRWQIETLFGCLKTRGFNFEDTHLTKCDRLEKLMCVLAITFCWAHKIGEWEVLINPIKLKKHGRKSVSLFRLGLDFIRHQLLTAKPKKRAVKTLIELLVKPPETHPGCIEERIS